MKPCVRCHRHVRRHAAVCPFCAAALLDAPAPTPAAWTLGLVMLAACGGKDPGGEDSSSGETTGTGTSSSDGSTDPTTTTAATPTTSGGESTSTGDSEGCGTACTEVTEAGGFIYGSPDAGQSALECSVELEDCPQGQKCMPVVTDGGGFWNGLKCMPVDPDPVGIGEACDAPGGGLDGVDNCDKHAMCFLVNGAEGTCVAMCDDGSACAAGFGCLNANDNVLQLCLPNCDLQDQDCPPGQHCSPVASGSVCVPGEGG